MFYFYNRIQNRSKIGVKKIVDFFTIIFCLKKKISEICINGIYFNRNLKNNLQNKFHYK